MKADAFALLGLPRRAMLSPEDVRAAFQRAGAENHPDNATTADDRTRRTAAFAALNDAHAVLSSLPRRLRHLLELEHPEPAASPRGAVMEPGMMELFSAVGAAVHAANAVQRKGRNAGTALARALLAKEEMQAQETVEAATRHVEAARQALEAELRQIDAARDAGQTDGSQLGSCAARAGFLEKWQAQLRAAFAGFFENS
jgi:curved DNA-binding protein CbpA